MVDNNTIKIIFAGDFCCIHPELLKMGDELHALIKKSDICELNFEGSIPHGNKVTPTPQYLKQNKQSPEWCIKNGFTLINLANNHAYDFGENGITYTLSKFTNQAIIVGVGAWEEAYKPKFIVCKGKRIGFLALSSADLSSLKCKYDNKNNIGCAWIGHPSIWNILLEAKNHCDYLFIMPHAGVEFMSVPLPEWRELYQAFIDLGCDGVIASHPHVPQGWEIYKDKPIVYSLGNFVFESEPPVPPLWNNGLIAQIICSENNGNVKLKIFNTIYTNHTVEMDNSEFAYNLNKELCEKLNGENYERTLIEEVNNLYTKYEGWLLSGLASVKMRPFSLKRFIKFILFNKSNYRVALHQLREESTRILMTRFLKNKSNTNL